VTCGPNVTVKNDVSHEDLEASDYAVCAGYSCPLALQARTAGRTREGRETAREKERSMLFLIRRLHNPGSPPLKQDDTSRGNQVLPRFRAEIPARRYKRNEGHCGKGLSCLQGPQKDQKSEVPASRPVSWLLKRCGNPGSRKGREPESGIETLAGRSPGRYRRGRKGREPESGILRLSVEDNEK